MRWASSVRRMVSALDSSTPRPGDRRPFGQLDRKGRPEPKCPSPSGRVWRDERCELSCSGGSTSTAMTAPSSNLSSAAGATDLATAVVVLTEPRQSAATGHRLVTNDDGPARTRPDGRLDTGPLTCDNADEAGRQRTREHQLFGLRIRRLGVRIPPSAPHVTAGQSRFPASSGM